MLRTDASELQYTGVIAAPRRDRFQRDATVIRLSVTALVLCALSATFMFFATLMSFAPRHKVVKTMLQEARRCGQSSLARRRGAKRSELLYSFRCNVVAVGDGGRVFRSRVLQRHEARALREHGDVLQLL